MGDENGSGNGFGTLREAFGALKGTVETFQKNWEKQDERASDSRRYLYEKMATVERSVGAVERTVDGLSHKVDAATKDIAEMKPAVTDWVASKNRGEGVGTALGYIWKALWAFGGASLMALAWFIEHFTKVLPH